MIRAVVHRSPPQAQADADKASYLDPDNFADKLVKYIPAEAIAFYTPMYAYVRTNVTATDGAVTKGPLVFVLLVTILGLLGYVYARHRSDNKTGAKITEWYYYPLAVLAFLCWAAGTSSVAQDLTPLAGWWDKVILLAGVFLIPLLDELFSGSS